jgi:amidase
MGREKFLIPPSILDHNLPSRWTPSRPVKHCPMRPPLLILLLACLLAGCERSGPLPVEAPLNLPRLRELDFSPFAESLDRIGSRRLAKIDRLVASGTVPAMQEALAKGELSSEELTLWFLNRIRRHDGHLRSYLELNPHALDEAREADRLRAAGEGRGPLHGIPLSIKDNLATVAPMHTTAGAEILLDHLAPADAKVVQHLRQAGAVILGKASLSELAGSLTTDPPGYNAISGLGVNPYRADLPVSGSSSGSAIATSARLAMVSIGTETSGSLISPGASNGVVAMKPSNGLVSGEGIVPLIRFQDSAGPIARSVTDAAILLGVIDETATDYAASLDAKALEEVAVGVLRKAILDEETNAAFWLTRIDEGLARAGAKAKDLDETFAEKPDLLPVIFLGLSRDTLPYLAAAGAPVKTVADLQAYNKAGPARRMPRGQNMVDLAVRVLDAIREDTGATEDGMEALYEEAALHVREGMAAILARTFAENEVDLLVSLANQHSMLYATAGYPAITVPLGLDESGTPNGITFIARPGEDAKLLAYAYAFEQATRYRVEVAID